MITGKGAAIGTKSINKVTIEPSDRFEVTVSKSIENTNLVDSCIKTFEEHSGIEVESVKISTYSPLPPSKGLKTSSSIACGILQALNLYYDKQIDSTIIINLSADASINAGVSITGAIDDAYATFLGGLVVTHNLNREVISRKQITNEQAVLFLIPPQSTPKNKIQFPDDLKNTSQLDLAIKKALQGKIGEAIKLNSQFYGQYLLKDPTTIYELQTLTKTIIGLNGGGPSLFAISKVDKVQNIFELIEQNFPKFKIFQTKYRL